VKEALAQGPHDLQQLGGTLFIDKGCVRCHTIGRGRFVGPDLKNVDKRYSPQDIVRWIRDPQEIYSKQGKMPVNEGYPPMPPPQDIHPMEAKAIAEYLMSVKVGKTNPEGGIITGKVLNKTSDVPVPGVNVSLKAFMGDNETGAEEAETASDGSFKFEKLAWDRSYSLSLAFDGAEYATDKMVFAPGEDVKTLDLPVFEPTMDDPGIKVLEEHTIFEISENGLNVGDIIIFDNPGDRIFIGSADLGDGRKESLKFDLPAEALNVSFMQGLDPESVVTTDTGFSDTESVMPGEKRVIFAYSMPKSATDAITIEKKIIYPTDSFLLLIPETKHGVDVSGGGLIADPEPVNMENVNYAKWQAKNLKPGDKVTVKFKAPGGIAAYLTGYVKWAALGLVLLLVGIGILYSSMGKGGAEKRKEAGDRERQGLLDKRSRLIQDIAALDDEFESGKISEDRYHKLRESMKEELVEVTRRLRL
jgi:cytochrome c551/c552/5-hydroxyisourate hydrolase-like protein (transthyretin family)